MNSAAAQLSSRNKTSPRWVLKAHTDAAHRRLDEGMARLDLTDAFDYRTFLALSLEAVSAVELALEAAQVRTILPDWAERSRRKALAEDLSAFGLKPTGQPNALQLSSRGACLGAAYVLEGSRLGGQILLRQAQKAGDPIICANTRYLSHGDASKLWPSFTATLDHTLDGAYEVNTACEAALAVFCIFQTAFGRWTAADRGENRWPE